MSIEEIAVSILYATGLVKRLGFVFMPMGCDITRWTPEGENLDALPTSWCRFVPGKQQTDSEHLACLL